jgi:hypothetical protein
VKSKTIRLAIRQKIDAWLASIEDENVRNLAAKNTIVTGGCIASMFLNEPVNDYDIYFKDRATTVAVANYYVSRFKPKGRNGIPVAISVDTSAEDRVSVTIKSAGIASEDGTETPYQYFDARPAEEAAQYVGEIMRDSGEIQDTYEQTEQAALDTEDEGKPQFRPVFMSTNAITLSHRVQIVLRFYGEPDAIHENYDFVHCTNYWTSWDNKVELRPAALEALLTKELTYVGSRYPVCSIIRLRKFIRRGWTVNAGQILKMVMQVHALDLTNIDVLRDQLTGVDSAYFCEVIQRLSEKDPQKVNHAYLIEIIDRMF